MKISPGHNGKHMKISLATMANLTTRDFPTLSDNLTLPHNTLACKPHCRKPKILVLPVDLSNTADTTLSVNYSFKITKCIKNNKTVKSTKTFQDENGKGNDSTH